MFKCKIGRTQCGISLLFPAVLLYLLLMDSSGLSAFAFVCAVTHECGHIIAVFMLKKKPLDVRVSFYGIRMVLQDADTMTFADSVLIALAGPFTNAVLSLLFLILCRNTSFSTMHLVYCVFNLLPILPLDGGRCLHAVLSACFSHSFTFRLMEFVFWIIWLPLCLLGVVLFFYDNHNMTLMIIGFYIGAVKVFYK